MSFCGCEGRAGADIVVLPWALAYVVWEGTWAHWLEMVVVVLIAATHLAISQPRSPS